MTTTTDTRRCKICNAEFKRSRNDSTVHCPAHRSRAIATPRKRQHDCVVCADTRTFTEQLSDGTMRTRPCPRCAS